VTFLTVCLNPTLQKTLCFNSIIPGTVNRTANHRLDVSGKGINVTRVLAQLEKKAVHLTQLGGNMKPLFLSLCEQDGLSIEWVESGSQIRFCYTLLTESDGEVTELVEESEPVTAATEKLLLEKFNALLQDNNLLQSKIRYLIISGTKAAGFSDAVFPYMVSKAKEKGIKIILDIRGKDLMECLKYEPDIIKPNLYEFASTFAPELIKNNDLILDNANPVCPVKEQIKTAVMETAHEYKCRVILTNGSRNVLAAEYAENSKGNFFEVEVSSVKAVNTIGGGDAFTAGLASALEDGADFLTAINEGIRCGALNAGLLRPGVIR
jgi:1-phosphofructokinase/tagatose 6-phosphate kinase